jgi:hypothetical protein
MLAFLTTNVALVTLVVIIHYELLYRFTLIAPKLRIPHRFRIVFGLLAALIAHVIEVFVFALAYFFIDRSDRWGHLQGNFDGNLGDSVYFSFTAYSTLGLGDIEPIGEVRYIVGLESLTGLILLTWTASFLYLEMSRYWDSR